MSRGPRTPGHEIAPPPDTPESTPRRRRVLRTLLTLLALLSLPCLALSLLLWYRGAAGSRPFLEAAVGGRYVRVIARSHSYAVYTAGNWPGRTMVVLHGWDGISVPTEYRFRLTDPRGWEEYGLEGLTTTARVSMGEDGQPVRLPKGRTLPMTAASNPMPLQQMHGLPLWLPVVLTALAPAGWLLSWWQRRQARDHRDPDDGEA